MDKIIFNVDSRHRNLQTYPLPEFFAIDLYETQKNIDYFRVTSIEIPNIYYIFSGARGSNSFRIQTDMYDWITISIDDGYYTISGLIDAINNAFSSTPLNGQIEISTDNNNNIVFTFSPGGAFYLDFSNNTTYKSLGYHLGFRKTNYTASGQIQAETPCDVIGEPYCFLRVNDYGNFHVNHYSAVKALYKITFSVDKKIVSFEDGSDLINKTHYFRQPVNLKTIEFELLDSYGNRLDNRGIDYSLTIEIGRLYDKKEYNKKMDPYSFNVKN